MTLGQWLGLFAIGAAFYILWQIRQLLLLLFTAVVLATAANGLVRRFQRFGFQRGSALLLTLGCVLIFVVLFVALVVPPFVQQVQELIQRVPVGLQQIRRVIPDVIDYLIRFVPPGTEGIQDFLGLIRAWAKNEMVGPTSTPSLTWDFTWLPDQAGLIAKNFFAFFNNALGVALQMLFLLVLTLMLLANPQAYRHAFLVLFPSFYRRRADEIFSECEAALTSWFSGVLISSTAIAFLSGIGLSMLGIDLALAHALLAGVLNFIPNIGPALSVIFPISVAILGPPWKVGAVVILYVVIQNVESYWLTPTIMARQVSLLPALTLIAQLFFASVFGALGLLLALPLTVVAKTWIQEWLIKDVLDRCDTPARRYHLALQPAAAQSLEATASSHNPAPLEVETVLLKDDLLNDDLLNDDLGHSVAIAPADKLSPSDILANPPASE